ncbi:MAG: GNAT family N-acetyltransferase [Rhodocyclaceae bacterium]|nr:GNAT family N-acetyltransferase [Rhodocyclaceae bacterium]
MLPLQLSAEEALGYYRRLDISQRAPSLHPEYLLADAQRSATLIPRFLVYQAGDHFHYHAFQMEAVPEVGLFDIQSPYGYGGPVATTTAPAFLNKAWNAHCRWCQENNILAEFIRFHPLLENWRYFCGEALDDRQTVWIDLAVPDLMTTYTPRVRTSIRKAMKNGLRVEWCDRHSFLTSFPRLYEETMHKLAADQFYFFSPAYFERITNPELARLAICRDDNSIYAAAIFLHGSEMVEYHLSASNEAGKTLGATNLLLHEAANWAQQSGKKKLHLGGGTSAAPENPLFFYKAGFSTHRSLFRIGKKIHRPGAYAALKADWANRKDLAGNRILFYR